MSPLSERDCENKCSSKKGQKHGDGTATATVTGKENVDRFLDRVGKGAISLCQDGCVIKGSPSVGVCEETSCPFTLQNVTYTGGQCKGGGVSFDESQSPKPENPKPPKEEEKPKPKEPKEPEEPLVCSITKNECPGMVNGKRVCVPCGSGDGSPKPPKPGASNPAGSGDGNGTGNGGTGNGQGTGNGNGQGNGTGPGSGGGSGSGSGDGKGDGNGKGEGKGDKEKGDGAGPSFGERPGLYEPKYKNGVKGVWDEKKGQLQNSGLGRLSKRLMPSVNSGNCPRWDIDLNFGRNMNFGMRNVAPPCSIWPILRAIVMVCALLLARRLVFGGLSNGMAQASAC